MKYPEVKTNESSPTASVDSNKLLTALWPSSDRFHQFAVLGKSTTRFTNIPVRGVAEAVKRAYTLSHAGIETYFACAEYLTPNSRTAANVASANAFWLDIDCGEGKGYATRDDAGLAVLRFCKDAGLPILTHVVDSGAGLHLYWVLDRVVQCETWQSYARKFKALTKALGLLANDSRTADITSVLHVPGTYNYKYDPPRPVVLWGASAERIEQATMLNAIDRAHHRLCPAASTLRPELTAT